jgi:hypothetical protein
VPFDILRHRTPELFATRLGHIIRRVSNPESKTSFRDTVSQADIRTADEKQKGNRLLLRFGAVDYECSVWVNGVLTPELFATRLGHIIRRVSNPESKTSFRDTVSQGIGDIYIAQRGYMALCLVGERSGYAVVMWEWRDRPSF